jgi:hypothetical protein
MRKTAVRLANDILRTGLAKTALRLVLGPSRYCIFGIVGRSCAGGDVGEPVEILRSWIDGWEES